MTTVDPPPTSRHIASDYLKKHDAKKKYLGQFLRARSTSTPTWVFFPDRDRPPKKQQRLDLPMTTTGAQTVKNLTASCSTPPMASFRYMNPTTVLIAIRTTLVGVAVFSVTRKRSVRIENVHMSMPLARQSKAQ